MPAGRGPAVLPTVSAVPSGNVSGPPQAVNHDALLDIQRSAGNRAATLAVQRAPAKAPAKTPSKPSAKPEVALPGAVATIILERAGSITGECKVAGHEGKIELHGVSFGAAPALGAGATRRDEGSREFIDVVLMKRLDSTSPDFMKAALDGDRVTVAKIEYLRAGADGAIEVVHTLELSNGVVTGVQVSGESESVSIQFEKPGQKED